MSAYIVDDSTINRILAGLQYSTVHGDCTRPIPKPWNNVTIEVHNDQAAETLGNLMFQMNIDAIEQRYGEGAAIKFRPLDYTFLPLMPNQQIHQLIKSINNFTYQCAEGNVPETNPLYKALDDYVSQLCRHIVARSPEYNRAQWG